MSLAPVHTERWACTPSVAAVHVTRIVWSEDGLSVGALERETELAKRLCVSLGRRLVLEVHVVENGDHQTSVEFLVPADLEPSDGEIGRRPVYRIHDMAEREHLTRRPVGFTRRRQSDYCPNWPNANG